VPGALGADQPAETVEIQKTISISIPGATAAYSLDSSIVEASGAGGVVQLHGISPGSATVIVVEPIGTISITVTVPQPRNPHGRRGGPTGTGFADSSESGSYEARYSSDPREFTNILELRRDEGESFRRLQIVNANYFGAYSLTIVVYDEELSKVESACSDFYKAFNVHDAQLYEEKYNLFNAYLATVPGNHAFNLRSMLILNTNYADYSLLYAAFRAQGQRPSGPGIPRRARNEPSNALLPESALQRHRPYRDPRADGGGEIVPPEFPHHQSAEIRSLHIHLRPGRELREPHAIV